MLNKNSLAGKSVRPIRRSIIKWLQATKNFDIKYGQEGKINPKQKQPGCKKVQGDIVSNDNQPKALISSTAKKVKLFIKNPFT